MSPETYFWFALALKMAMAAGFVIVATVTAERAGAAIGALIATLPVSAGPAYIFLALDHDSAFVAQSALSSVTVNPGTALYALTFILLAQRHGAVVSVGAGIAVWLAVALITRLFEWNVIVAIAFNAVIFPLCWKIAYPFRDARMPRMPLRWYDFVIRAAMVALLVATVVTLSFRIGPAGTGILAVFPIVYTSIMIIMHHRVGGKAAAAVLAHGFSGLAGFGAAVLTLHLLAVLLGTPAALVLAFVVSIVWNLSIHGIRRRRARIVAGP